jgi:trimethylamine--corrinoid protein Co-methyltransferase
VALQSGANLIHDVGYLEAGLTDSPEMVVFTCEAIRMLRRYGEGLRLDEEALALAVIQQTGPGGNFLAADHTLEHFREFWQPELFSRQRLAAWQEEGAKSLGRRVREKTVELLRQAQGSPLPASQAKEVDYLLK